MKKNNIMKHLFWSALKLGMPVAALAFIMLHTVVSTRSSETDSDNDGLPDDYELFFGLNTNLNDSSQDPDSDGLANIDEYLKLSDPFAPDTDRDGFDDLMDSNAVSRAYIRWGDPKFTTGNQYDYAAPAWVLSAWKIDGAWTTSPPSGDPAWHVSASESNGVGALIINLDRGVLTTNNLRFKLRFYDHTNASLYLDLLDTNPAVIGSDLFGNLMTGSNAETIVILPVPLATNAAAAAIQLRRGTGELTVYEGLLYIDEDGDGLDADQEAQLGTSDHCVDTDSDGLADGLEVIYGTDPLYADTDGDGLTDGWETANGLNPLNADTDGDGMNDWDELRYGQNPAGSNVYARLPFVEMVETDTVQIGPIHGQNGWEAAPTNDAFVQTNTVYEGAQALSLSNNAGTEARHLFVCTNQVVWVDMAQLMDPCATPTGAVTVAAAWLFNNSGQLKVYDGLAGTSGAWVTLTNHSPCATGQWVRVVAALNYGARRWQVYLNGVMLAYNLGFSTSAADHFTAIVIKGKCGIVDNIKLSLSVPEDVDSDNDGMPDWWETANGFNPNDPSDASGDADGDGLTNLQEYQYWTDPYNADTDGDGYSDGIEVQWGTDPASASSFPHRAISGLLTYAGSQTGMIYVALTTNGVGGSIVESQSLSQPSAFAFTNVPVLKTYWIVAWRDSNGNASNDFWEAQGDLAANPVYLNADVTNADITLSDPDTDEDGLPDWWEMKWFGSMANGADDDSDDDGLTNLQEYQRGSNPYNSDTDADGMSDGWEVAHNLDPLVNDASLDPDSDGLTNLQEYQHGTDPHNADTDGDGIPDGWEVAHNLDPLVNDAALDPDNDGLTNLQEYQYGTNPYNADTDGDGMNDWDELRYGQNPAGSNVYARLPFVEMVETNTVQIGPIHGQNGWEAAPTNDAFVQTNTVYEGAQALSLSNNAGTEARHLFVCTNQVVWVDMAQLMDPCATPTGAVTVAAAWLFNNSGQLKVYDGLAGTSGAWVTLTNHSPCATGQWVRVVAALNYGARRWQVYLNGVMLAYNLGFSTSAADHFTAIVIKGKCGIVDNITLSLTPPENVNLDSDNDGMPDWWETANGFNPNNPSDANGDADGDGLTNLQEYQYWTDPHNEDTDGDGILDGWEVANGLNPLNTDTDGDGMPDGWELDHDFDPLDSGDADLDADNDGLSNLAEYQHGTDPHNADTDGDGIPDGWEVAHNLDPLVNDAALDPDNDGLTNLQEYQYGTNPYNADTDGDGITDGIEVQWGTDPASASSFPHRAISGLLTYTGPQPGPIYVALTTNGVGGSIVESQSLSQPGAFAFTNVPFPKTYWIMAWRDSNGNASNDFWEAQGDSAANPVYLATDVTNADITLSDPDTDEDGLPDWWEMKWFASLANGAGDDPDNDGVANLQEYQYGTDPGNWDTDGDGISDGADPAPLSRAAMYWGRPQLWTNGLYSYPGPAWFCGGMQTNGQLAVYNGVLSCWYGPAWNLTNQGALLIGVDRNILTNDAWIKVASVYGCALRADLLNAAGACLASNVCGNLAPESIASPWRKAIVPLASYPSACWIRLLSSGGSPAYVNTTLLYVDRDGDGIDEENELANGTSDIVPDGTNGVVTGLVARATESDTNMVVQESQMTPVQSILGRTNSACTGAWVADGDGLWCASRRGSVEYTFDAPVADIYRGVFVVREQNPVPGQQKNFDLRFTVDGEYVRRQTVSVVGVATGTVSVWTPWLPAGEHRIAVFFDNADINTILRIERLDIGRFAGSDTNSDGLTDWAEGIVKSRNGVDVAPETSVVSPVCVEGVSRYLGLLSVTGSTNTPVRGSDWRWYLNVDLPAAGTNLGLDFSFENGVVQETRQLQWAPLNMAQAPSNCILRTGDQLKLTVNDGQTNAAQITVNGVVLGYVLPGESLIQAFSTAGVYQVESTGGSTNYALTVKVLPTLTNQTIVALAGRYRDWLVPVGDDDAVWQWDSRLQVDNRLQVTNSWELKGFTVASPLPEEYAGVARAGSNGPVLGQVMVKGLRIWGGAPGRMWRDKLSADGTYGSWIVTELVIQSPVVAEATVRSDIAASGITFADGSRTVTLAPADFDSLGQANIFYFNQSSVAPALCHYLKLFQGNYFIEQ